MQLIQKLSLALIWIAISLLLECLRHFSSWNGVHEYGKLSWESLLAPFCIWVHLDIPHALNNALLCCWMMIQFQLKIGVKKSFLLSLVIAIDLCILEELVHLWSPLPAAMGASAWLYGHLPMCIYWALKDSWWKSWLWSLPFFLMVMMEDLILVNHFLSPANLFHLMGFLLGCAWLVLMVKLDGSFNRDN